jgi:Asp-tRNA(Asn)/Glu-tRNA(Gln) amidotransferase A subunit family amidase
VLAEVGMTAIHHVSAKTMAAAFSSGALSPVEVVRACLARITAWDGKINAMYSLDAAGALDEAAAAEARWRAGTPKSALDGVPITVKDNIAVGGVPMPIGTAAGDMTPSAADAPPVARMREAGCIILGKTTMPDYGMLASGVSSLHGITRNPWNTERNPGGSSSGAAAGLAAGYAPLALGSDIGGSVRLPAAYNGVFALKPSLGRVPMYPPFLGRTVGPMTRTVTDAALMMKALTRPDARDFMALPYQDIDWPAALDMDLAGKRIGLVLDIGFGLKPQARIREAVEAAADLAARFQRETQTQFTIVPYRAAGAVVQDLVAGRIDLAFATLTTHLPMVRNGSEKAIAVASEIRSALAPEIPTFAEMGLPTLTYANWYGLFAPRGTPAEIVGKLNAAAVAALADPAVKARLIDVAVEVIPREEATPQALAAMQKADAEKWWPMVKELGLKAE